MSDQESKWVAVTALPNIEVSAPVEGGLAALAPRHDARVKAICKAQPRVGKFLSRFTDAFGQRLRPAVLIVRRDAPDSIFTVEALASFRDAIALSTIPYNRAQELRHTHGHRINFSNTFWFYPWMVDRFGEGLVASTPAMLGTHDVDAFKGQSSPEIARRVLTGADLDKPLLKTLLERWSTRYTTRRPAWEDRALFRSLNMANNAALIPAGSDMTFYDVGRSIALWVGAFEILVHPGKGKSGLFPVYELLDRVNWYHKACAARRYKAYVPGRNPPNRRSLGCWLYGEIYDVRNQFLHGNPVTRARLMVRGSSRSLFQYAAPLYRMALAGFLPLTRPAAPSTSAPQVLGEYIVTDMEFAGFQKTIERGLLTARARENSALRRSPRRAG